MRRLTRQRDRAGLVLASESPRRRELLARIGQPFEVEASGVDECVEAGEDPVTFASRLARDKASEVSRRRPDAWVLGADTIVVIDGEVLGKPADAAEARSMLHRLAGRAHEVVTAYALVGPGGAVFEERQVRSTVVFRDLTPGEIESYVAGGEPFGKAGAYAIQGGAGAFVAELSGSFTNVVGLPLEEVSTTLSSAGFGPSEPRA
jgi:septum formation protein